MRPDREPGGARRAPIADDRSRLVTWADPERIRAAADRLTGLQVNQAVRDGTLPEPPTSRLLGIRCVAAADGEVSAELCASQELENLGGVVHGGVLAALLDTVMGAALQTRLPPAGQFATVDLKITYLRPLTARSARIRATGRVKSAGRRLAYVEGEIRDEGGELAVHAVGNFVVRAARKAASSSQEALDLTGGPLSLP